MNSKYLRIMGAFAFISLIFALHSAYAAPQPAPKGSLQLPKTLKAKPKSEPFVQEPMGLRMNGVVSVTKNASNEVTAIKVGKRNISLDDGSDSLKGMDGWKVRVTGRFIDMPNGTQMFHVKSIVPVEVDSAGAVQSNKVEGVKPVQKASDILTLDSWELQNTQGVFFVTGVIHTTAETVYNVKIHFGLYNKSREKTGGISAITETLKIKELWRFKIKIPNDFDCIKPVLITGEWYFYHSDGKTLDLSDRRLDQLECPLEENMIQKSPGQ
ncbi:MAG: FxLYD domain-containing protein [Kiritimatiellia bacterium]|nr:FxLYD domain-containing protein [Kiritimatiellia bacterium]